MIRVSNDSNCKLWRKILGLWARFWVNHKMDYADSDRLEEEGVAITYGLNNGSAKLHRFWSQRCRVLGLG